MQLSFDKWGQFLRVHMWGTSTCIMPLADLLDSSDDIDDDDDDDVQVEQHVRG